jgi:hypothetical protein
MHHWHESVENGVRELHRNFGDVTLTTRLPDGKKQAQPVENPAW